VRIFDERSLIHIDFDDLRPDFILGMLDCQVVCKYLLLLAETLMRIVKELKKG